MPKQKTSNTTTVIFFNYRRKKKNGLFATLYKLFFFEDTFFVRNIQKKYIEFNDSVHVHSNLDEIFVVFFLLILIDENKTICKY